MKNSKYYVKIKRYYDKGYYTNRHIMILCRSGALTEEEYKSITGLDYPNV